MKEFLSIAVRVWQVMSTVCAFQTSVRSMYSIFGVFDRINSLEQQIRRLTDDCGEGENSEDILARRIGAGRL